MKQLIILLFLLFADKTEASEARRIEVVSGETVTLPCNYKNVDKVAIIWQRTNVIGESAMLFSDNSIEIKDPRFEYVNASALVTGDYSIRIKGVQWHQDAGVYECMYLGDPQLNTQYDLYVKSPPVVSITPEKSPYIVELNKLFFLRCIANGEPKPTVTWSRKDRNLPETNARELNTEVLRFERATSDHAGTYVCSANNGVGDPVQALSVVEIRQVKSTVSIEFEPDQVKPAAGSSFRAICFYDSISKVTVDWFLNGRRIDSGPNSKVSIVTDPKQSILTKSSQVQIDDFGNYTCSVNKKEGSVQTNRFLGGPPTKAVFKTELNDENGRLKILWTLQSISPILETNFTYKKVSENQFLQAAVAAKKGPSEHEYKGEHSLEKFASMDSDYEVQVSSRNQFGWSDVSTHIVLKDKASSAYKHQSETVTADAKQKASSAMLSPCSRLLTCSFVPISLLLVLVTL